jgi:hypothetical protein
MTAAPQNGTQAHDLSRELGFGRPAQVGATPFWDAAVRRLALLGSHRSLTHKTTE